MDWFTYEEWAVLDTLVWGSDLLRDDKHEIYLTLDRMYFDIPNERWT